MHGSPITRISIPLDYETGIAGVDTGDARALFEMGRGFLFDTAKLSRACATDRMRRRSTDSTA